MHFKWNYEAPTPEQQKTAKELGDKLNVSPILGQLLIQRGITTESAAKRFFRPQLADLINPFLMKDMDVAVDRLNDAMGRKERILVYGDYDVDGCTAVALVYKFLQQFYSNIEYYIPDRYDEGYGVSKKGIDYAHETGVKLIIILDCGIKAVKEIEYAKTLGIDFIICDHHVPDEVMPPAVAIQASLWMWRRLQIHAGFCQGQRNTFLTTHSPTRFLCRQHCCRHRTGSRREPHPGFPWSEATQLQSQHRPEIYHRYLRTQRT